MPRPMEQVCFAGLFFFYAFASLFFFMIIFRFGKKQQMKGICRNISSFARRCSILNSFCKTVFQVLQKPYSGDVYERDAPRHLQGVLFFVTLAVSVFLYRLRFFAQCAKSGCRNFSEAAAVNLSGSRKRIVQSGSICLLRCALRPRRWRIGALFLQKQTAKCAVRRLVKRAAVQCAKGRRHWQAHRYFHEGLDVFVRVVRRFVDCAPRQMPLATALKGRSGCQNFLRMV